MNISESDLQSLLSRSSCKIAGEKRVETPKPSRPSRERNHKIVVNGEKYDSKWEYERHQQLLTMQKYGEISELRRQVEFILAPSVVIHCRKRPPLRYFLDFQYKRKGEWVYEDAKGKQAATDTFRIKRHLMKSVHGIDITEVRKHGK